MESMLISPVGDVDSPHRRLHKRRTRLSAARKRHFCGSVITYYNTYQPCGLQSVVGPPRGNGGMGFVLGESLRTCVQKVGTHVRSKTAKFSYIWVAI